MYRPVCRVLGVQSRATRMGVGGLGGMVLGAEVGLVVGFSWVLGGDSESHFEYMQDSAKGKGEGI